MSTSRCPGLEYRNDMENHLNMRVSAEKLTKNYTVLNVILLQSF